MNGTEAASAGSIGRVRARSARAWSVAAVVAAACAAATPAAGQSDDRSKEALREEARKLFGDGTQDQGSGEARQDAAWSIVLASFRGEGRQEAAAAVLERVRTKGRVPEAFMEDRGAGTVIAFGRFAGPQDTQARAELERIRALEVDGVRPYEWAFLAPPAIGPATGAMAEYDLRRVRELYGKDALYTLQVGMYTRGDLKPPSEKERQEFAKLAEEAVATLRREGELAFFYHGLNGSTVTVGVFGPMDYDPKTPREQSPVLLETRKRFPHNLVNGKGVRRKIPGAREDDPKAYVLEPSGLVVVPEH